MSEVRKAWSWRQAFCKSDLPGPTRAVLQALSMFMNAVGESCYPSIEDLVEYSGFSKNAVLKHIDIAKEAGWIEVSQHGFRGQRWKRQEYVARWPEHDLVAPSTSERIVKNAEFEEKGGARGGPPPLKKVVHEVGEGGARGGPKVVHEVDQDKNSPLNNPIPVQERKCARDGESDKNDNNGTVTRETWMRRLKKAHERWPSYESDGNKDAEKAWFALSSEDREQASKMLNAYVAVCKRQGRTKFRVFANYLSEKLWEKLPANAASNGGSVELAKAYGKVWGVYRFADLLKPPNSMPKPPATIEGILNGGGEQAEAEKLRRLALYGWPRVVDMHNHAARRGGGLTVKGKLVPLADEFLQVRVGNDIWQAWKQLHGERGWPWFGPDRDLPEWVYMPKLLTEEFPSTLEAVRAALASFVDVYARFAGETTATQEAAE
ncbi:helix-turn-helix domain-containing protein [Pseudovibrio sp. Tun.PSC04-5.I4]|uniref:helix-turn-helix domain-containing protein n=1 Tax=Pseudovibrio sp. Tun.PSC04-5.I4 TaxID=1798213 RepID=UPI00088BFBEF|nr:helix-turn-helix domain-containing protein [Pseudovibrio sp. Tun.PSC04-5.I4]SDR09967.1 Helix-turn-helix domain-containing protein [Pseudovibrio sp. Tun.PSC04-5.I4]